MSFRSSFLIASFWASLRSSRTTAFLLAFLTYKASKQIFNINNANKGITHATK